MPPPDVRSRPAIDRAAVSGAGRATSSSPSVCQVADSAADPTVQALHRTYQLLPGLAGLDLARLRADIAERGVMVPVEVDENGAILDGHHRQRIADELGIDFPRVVRRGMAEHEKRLHAVALNLARRHLTDAQQVALGMKIEPDVRERARLRMAQAGAKSAPGKAVTTDAPLPAPQRSVDETARSVGLGSGRTYERHTRTLAAAPPEVRARAEAGELDMRGVRQEVRKAHKEERVAQIAAAPVAALPTEQTYPVLLCDPPWRYEGAESDSRKIENHYPTMSATDLHALDVPAADDSVLFLWATSPKLAEAFDLLAAWGFTYRTCLVWVKDRIGMGYYARQQHELLLVARRGELPVPDPQDRPSSVIHAPRGKHSAKPDRVYELIEAMYPRFQRCELFARTPRSGWASYGNEIAEAEVVNAGRPRPGDYVGRATAEQLAAADKRCAAAALACRQQRLAVEEFR